MAAGKAQHWHQLNIPECTWEAPGAWVEEVVEVGGQDWAMGEAEV